MPSRFMVRGPLVLLGLVLLPIAARAQPGTATLGGTSVVSIGSTLSLDLGTTPALPGADLLVLADDALGSVTIPGPGGTVLGTTQLAFSPNLIVLADASGVFGPGLAPGMTDATGSWNLTVPIPVAPALVGLQLFAEAFAIDVNAANGVFRQSNVFSLSFTAAPPPSQVLSVRSGSSLLWVAGQAVSSGPVALNAPLVFEFDGPVSAASVAPPGPAVGPINIVATAAGSIPAFGRFDVVDDPSLPAGNARWVRFTPSLPADPQSPTGGGLAGGVIYDILVTDVGTGGPTLLVGGSPLGQGVVTPMQTCNPSTLSDPIGCFVDVIPGSPTLAGTVPPMSPSLASAPLVDSFAISGNTVSITLTEPLFPGGIDPTSVRLLHHGFQQPLPGQVLFWQAGLPEVGPTQSRIDFVAAYTLPPGVLYELQLGPAIRDFGGNPAMVSPGNRLFFETVSVALSPGGSILEDFSTTSHAGLVSSAMVWDGSGFLYGYDQGVPGFVAPTAESLFFDTCYPYPDYTGTGAFTDLGNIAGATLSIEYQGALESPTQPGTPDLASLTPWVTAASLDALDGHRFCRFKVTMSYFTGAPGAVTPSVDQLVITFASLGCWN